MKDLRNLLIDCRIELRKLVRDFHKTELCARLDMAMQSLANVAATPVVPDGEPRPAPAPGLREIKETSNQVALAWQMAARDLKFSDPRMYEAMSRKVMARLETKTLVDQVDELRQAEQHISDLKDAQVAAEKDRVALEVERDTLLGALAEAVPTLADGGDRIGVALARIDCLKSQATKNVPTITAATVAAEENTIPGADVLAKVAAGARQFTKAQREWCVGEAMVLSGFEFTPMELIDQGDARIASIICQARNGR